MKNLEKLEDLREALITHPQQHDQATFCTDSSKNPLNDCGTSACAAGWTLALEGLTVLDVSMDKADPRSVSMRAADILGLDFAESEALFFDTLDYDDNAETEAIKLIDVYIGEAMKERFGE